MDHYKKLGKESIVIMRYSMTDEEFYGFLLGNVYKYINRHKYKGNPKADIGKAIHYLEALLRVIENPQCENPFEELRNRESKAMAPESVYFSPYSKS